MNKNIKMALKPLTWKHYVCAFCMSLGVITVAVEPEGILPFVLALALWNEYLKLRKEHKENKEQFNGVKHYFALRWEERCKLEGENKNQQQPT